MAGICGAVAFGGYGNLQIAAFYHRRDIKIAQFRTVDYVTEDFELLAVGVDLPVENLVISSCNGQCSSGEIFFAISTQDKFDIWKRKRRFKGRKYIGSNDDDPAPVSERV